MSSELSEVTPTISLPGAKGTFAYLLQVTEGERKGVLPFCICGALDLLSRVYLGALNLSRLVHRIGIRRCEQAECPIICVGNLSVGGTGKSTATAAIAGWLRDAGLRPAVLSRGYGGNSTQPVRVVSDGERILLEPREAGDEPVMLAQKLPGVPVLVGRRRPLTARAATAQFGADVCILDDGSQVWNLKKDLEIILLNAERAFENGHVLPRGMLREPPSHLRRADAVLLMEPGRAHPETLAALREQVRALVPRAVIAEAARTPEALRDLASGTDLSLERLRGRRVVALSGIGNPAGFETLLQSLGAIVFPLRLPDHHHYTAADLQQAQGMARRHGADAVLTTEKDAVKFTPALENPVGVPIWVLSIRLQFHAGEADLRALVLSTAERMAHV